MHNGAESQRPLLVTGDKTNGDVTRDICAPIDRQADGRSGGPHSLSPFRHSCLGVAAVWYQIATGIGTWGLNKTVGWAFDITNFVFWVGIGHAGTLISAVLFLCSVNNGEPPSTVRAEAHDTIRGDVCRNFSVDSHGATLAGVLDGALSEYKRSAVGQLQISAPCGTCLQSRPT